MEGLEVSNNMLQFEVFIGSDYKLTSDKLNIIVNKRYDKKDKEGNVIGEGWKNIGFYGNVEKALVALLNKEINQSYVNTVDELLQTIRVAQNEIVKAIKNNSL